MLPGRQIFLVDTHVNVHPTAEKLAEITIMAVGEVRRFGIEPKIALVSHSNFGRSKPPSAQKMRPSPSWLKLSGTWRGVCARITAVPPSRSSP